MQKTALVTGGNSGIGYATAYLLKKKGYSVVISGRTPKKIKKAAAELGVEYIVADMQHVNDIKKMASFFKKDGLDALVNNAAKADLMPLNEITSSDYSIFFNTNIRGPMELIQRLLPAFEKRGGSITNISSIAANNGLVNGSLYAATKGALEAATRTLALELAPKKIRVNAVSPGAIDTPLLKSSGVSQKNIDSRRAVLEKILPLKRYGTAEEVAHVVYAQLEASYVTGAIWVVDGGADVLIANHTP